MLFFHKLKKPSAMGVFLCHNIFKIHPVAMLCILYINPYFEGYWQHYRTFQYAIIVYSCILYCAF